MYSICSLHAAYRLHTSKHTHALMLAAVICFVSVLSTASLASFGMDAASISSSLLGPMPKSIESAADEDVVRISDDQCHLFHAFFASAAILVAILYYAIVKGTLMAMGAVIMAPPKPHPLYCHDDDDNDELSGSEGRVSDNDEQGVLPSDNDDCEEQTDTHHHNNNHDRASSNSTLSLSASSDEEEEYGPYQVETPSVGGATATTAADESKVAIQSNEIEMREIVTRGAAALEGNQQALFRSTNTANPPNTIVIIHHQAAPAATSESSNNNNKHQQHRRAGSTIPRSDSNVGAMFEIEEVAEDITNSGAPRGKHANKKHRSTATTAPTVKPTATTGTISERFNAVKIWTNIYGLSMGIYCLVYSLLLPNELSAFVFSVVALVAGVHDVVIPCMHVYLNEEQYEMLNQGMHQGSQRKRWASSSSSSSSPSFKRQFKRCLGWLCLFQSSVASELSEAAVDTIKGSRLARRAKRLRTGVRSSSSSSSGSKGSSSSRCSLGHCCRDTCLDLLDCLLCCVPFCKTKGKGNSSGSSSSRPASFLRSGALAMPTIILLIAIGLACKAMQDIHYKDAVVHELLKGSAFATTTTTTTTTATTATTNTDTNTNTTTTTTNTGAKTDDEQWSDNNNNSSNSSSVGSRRWLNETISDEEAYLSNGFSMYGFTDPAGIFVNIFFPIAGVLMLKSMRKAENVRETIELTVPVCALNSMCIALIIMLQAPACLMKHFSSTIVGLVQPGGGHGTSLENANHPMVLMRYQPILAALALPFPLVCSIVCIVAAGRNHRFMVSLGLVGMYKHRHSCTRVNMYTH